MVLLLQVAVIEVKNREVVDYLGSAEAEIKYTQVDIDGLPRMALESLYENGILDLKQAILNLDTTVEPSIDAVVPQIS